MKVVDLDQELSSLFRGEEMMAFFDFLLPLGDGERCEGLCRISRPRAGSGDGSYFSVLFMIDTPAPARRNQLDALLRDADWEACAERLPVRAEALPMPASEAGGDAWVMQVDFVLGAGPRITEERLCRDVVGALRSTLGIEAGEITTWQADAPAPAPAAGSATSGWQRALDRVRGRKR
jgi:hypothetical protein